MRRSYLVFIFFYMFIIGVGAFIFCLTGSYAINLYEDNYNNIDNTNIDNKSIEYVGDDIVDTNIIDKLSLDVDMLSCINSYQCEYLSTFYNNKELDDNDKLGGVLNGLYINNKFLDISTDYYTKYYNSISIYFSYDNMINSDSPFKQIGNNTVMEYFNSLYNYNYDINNIALNTCPSYSYKSDEDIFISDYECDDDSTIKQYYYKYKYTYDNDYYYVYVALALRDNNYIFKNVDKDLFTDSYNLYNFKLDDSNYNDFSKYVIKFDNNFIYQSIDRLE